MTDDVAVNVLGVLRVHLVAQRMRIARKRSWRASEKAMASAQLGRQIEALDVARGALGERSTDR